MLCPWDEIETNSRKIYFILSECLKLYHVVLVTTPVSFKILISTNKTGCLLVVPKSGGRNAPFYALTDVIGEVILGTVGLQFGSNSGNRTHNLIEPELCSTTATEYHFVFCCKHPGDMDNWHGYNALFLGYVLENAL